MTKDEVWEAALQELEQHMTRATFETWIKTSHLVSLNDDKLVIAAKSAFAKDWLENRLFNTINRTIATILDKPISLRFVVDAAASSDDETPKATLLMGASTKDTSLTSDTSLSEQGPYENKNLPSLNSKYTFDQFVVGASNRLAHAASLAVAEYPGETYNPLFLYGGVGLGKTHLLQAIAHYAHADGNRVSYITSENFTNDLIESIRSQSMDNFREKYRTIDFLLIDDIQFIAGKESTQEELFHTFNELHSSGGQVVLSSDRPPKAIHTLEDRLLSRFEWGLLADVQPPDLETRIAILRFKADLQKVNISHEVIEFIARRAKTNIRELEGAFNKVVAQATMANRPIDMALTQEALEDMTVQRAELTVEQIISAVARFYQLDEKILIGRNRTKHISLARQMAMYIAREETEASLPRIGKALGDRDHTTIKHGWEKIANAIEVDDKLRREMLAIRELIYTNNDLSFY